MTPGADIRYQSYTVDASVVFKWFAESGESDLHQARSLQKLLQQDQITLYAPDLLLTEIANALRYKSGITKAAIDLAVESLVTLASLKLMRVNIDLLRRATTAAFTGNLSIYDACYVAVAELTDTPLITADRQLFKHYRQAIPLKSFQN